MATISSMNAPDVAPITRLTPPLTSDSFVYGASGWPVSAMTYRSAVGKGSTNPCCSSPRPLGFLGSSLKAPGQAANGTNGTAPLTVMTSPGPNVRLPSPKKTWLISMNPPSIPCTCAAAGWVASHASATASEADRSATAKVRRPFVREALLHEPKVLNRRQVRPSMMASLTLTKSTLTPTLRLIPEPASRAAAPGPSGTRRRPRRSSAP